MNQFIKAQREPASSEAQKTTAIFRDLWADEMGKKDDEIVVLPSVRLGVYI